MQLRFIFSILLVMPFLLYSQELDKVRVTTEYQMGKFSKIVPTGPAKRKVGDGIWRVEHPEDPTPHPDRSRSNIIHKKSIVHTTSSGDLVVGEQFEANHLYGVIPADPTIAIANDGSIVTIDNATVGYFKENGDTIVKFRLPLSHWYSDSTLTDAIFDPRLVYDSYDNRFIAVLAYRSFDYFDSRLLVSFSEPLGPDSVSWNHYQINTDSIYSGDSEFLYWLDFPSIAINKNELFITTNVFEYDSTDNSSSKKRVLLLQLAKSDGYSNNQTVDCREWLDLRNGDGFSSGTFVPLGDGFQSMNYGPGCFLVSNYVDNSTKFFWYELTGNLNDPNSQVISHTTSTSFFYSFPSFASQMGGNGSDRIRFGDCKIHSGYHQNRSLHFVFHRSDNGWGEIVYARINTISNSFIADTWGGEEQSLNSMYPAVAPFGKDSSEEKAILTFNRTGPTIWPEVCAIAFDSAWSQNVAVIKSGLGVIDQKEDIIAPWDSLERIGDYNSIQRKYNDPNNACWLIGSYAAGPTPNFFGVVDGIKSWVAEVGDSSIVGINRVKNWTTFQLYPNPITSGANLNVRLDARHDFGTIEIYDIYGSEIFSTKYRDSNFVVQLPAVRAGTYFLKITSEKYHRYAVQKILIHH